MTLSDYIFTPYFKAVTLSDWIKSVSDIDKIGTCTNVTFWFDNAIKESRDRKRRVKIKKRRKKREDKSNSSRSLPEPLCV